MRVRVSEFLLFKKFPVRIDRNEDSYIQSHNPLQTRAIMQLPALFFTSRMSINACVLQFAAHTLYKCLIYDSALCLFVPDVNPLSRVQMDFGKALQEHRNLTAKS
jgi:hypothetical protein